MIYYCIPLHNIASPKVEAQFEFLIGYLPVKVIFDQSKNWIQTESRILALDYCSKENGKIISFF